MLGPSTAFLQLEESLESLLGTGRFFAFFICMGGKGTCVQLLSFSSSECCLSFLAIFFLFSLSACLFHLPYLIEQYIHSPS